MLGFFRIYLIFLLFLLPFAGFGQRTFGTWSIFNGRYNLNERVAIWSEFQLRSTAIYNDFFYWEWKGGVNYDLNDHITVTAGTGRYHTYTIGDNFSEPLTQGETRVWEQVVMENQLGRLNIDHRYRIEQRFTTNGYRNRFRYRLNVICPLNKPKVSPRTLYAYIGDEIFFTNRKPFYERNRFFAGLGYRFTQTFMFQLGVQRQYDYSLTSETSRDFLQSSFLFIFNRKERDDHRLPKPTD